MKKHTLGKWEMQKISSHNEEIVGVWAVPGGECIAFCNSGSADNQANAAFIVQACNSHDELLAALKWMTDEFLCHVNFTPAGGDKDAFHAYINQARIIIQKAEGGGKHDNP